MRILPVGVAVEDDVSDTVVDAALWVILATAVALIVLGCWVTRRVPKAARQDPDQQVDRAV
jgi:flagellar biogenesis protein FliO